MRSVPAPSMVAASSSSLGIVRKYCLSRNTLKALAKKWGTISGNHVPTHPMRRKIV